MRLIHTLKLNLLRKKLTRNYVRLLSTNGLKPNFKEELSAKYFEYDKMERDIYGWWEKSGYFKPRNDSNIEETFVLPMPPPNVTGYLHMGHAIFLALQDIMTRFHRMRGKNTLWLPGTDHAGIATQLLVEKQLENEGTSRFVLGRENFLERVWQWKKDKGDYITKQMRRLGASADWSREKFTLDDDMNSAVTEAFIRLYDKGLVYKGSYMVNWSSNLQTAVSDLEVEYSEELGRLYYFKYYLDDGQEFLSVATTRPETILGDTAVCVHPNDPRYRSFIGRTVRVPMTNRTIPVIADEYVDMEFGTGALKITPAHDINDYKLGKKHNLPLINIMNKDGTINAVGGKYEGLDRFRCRTELWRDMQKEGMAIKEVDHMQRIPRSQRGGDVIEPLVSTQWFVHMSGMAAKATQAVENKELQILPERFEKEWFNWLGAENIQDWCISRQLWWGHRIPVYYVRKSRSDIDVVLSDEKDFIVAKTHDEAMSGAFQKYGRELFESGQLVLEQEQDVLDTWFSSGLWPFATVGWPDVENSKDFNKFYPATVLETGYDILFFWVARMVTMGLELTGQLPFKTIYLHGLVRDKDGQKMSKTKGNVIDPINTIDAFGCDALRYTLVTGATPGNDIPLSLEKVETSRNFVNKLWNLGKFINNVVEQHAEIVLDQSIVFTQEEFNALPLPERYIVSKLHETIDVVTTSLECFQFGEAGKVVNDFIWDEFADWFVEISKVHLRSSDSHNRLLTAKLLLYTWERCLCLLHPFMPFITETLWQQLPIENKPASLMISHWPLMYKSKNALATDLHAVQSFIRVKNMVKAVRNVRTQYNVEASKKLPIIIISEDHMLKELHSEREALMFIMKLDGNEFHMYDAAQGKDFTGCIHVVVDDKLEVYLPQHGIIDNQKEIARLLKQRDKITRDLQLLEERIAKPSFVEKAPQNVVQEVTNKIHELKAQITLIEKSLTQLV